MRVFDYNYCFKTFGGTYTASSSTDNADACFDEMTRTFWESDGEGTDGNAVYVERDFGIDRTFNRIFVIGTNIKDLDVTYWNGASFVSVSVTPALSAEYTYNGNGYLVSAFYELPADVTAQIIRVVGSNTNSANCEKQIQQIYVFSEIGEFQIPPKAIVPKRVKRGYQHELDNAKYFSFIKGTRFELSLKFTAHVGQADIDIIEEIIDRDAEFYLWINNDQEDIMTQTIEPFRFRNVLKMIVDKGDDPQYYKNLFFSGITDTINLVESA